MSTHQPAMPDLPSVEGYTTIKKLGSGAYGDGYLIKDANQSDFFLKLQRGEAPRDASLRFENEIAALKNLESIPGFVQLISNGDISGRSYYVSTLANGKTLREVLEHHQEQHGTPLGPRFVAQVAISVLKHLSEIQTKGYYHRDLKDDNIFSTESGNDVTLIDFGQCKGPNLPHSDITWGNPGAARFSAPGRDRNPSLVHSTHDVYSLGIICFLLLTGIHPFNVDQNAGPDALTELKERRMLPAIWTLNSWVPDDFSRWVLSALNPDDNQRSDPSQALQSLIAIKREMDANLGTAATVNSRKSLRYPEVIRDPLHGDIRLTDIEYKICRSEEFYRLHNVLQLGFAYLPYPGAVHTRYLHSIGCLHVVEKIMTSIEKVTGQLFSPDDRLLTRAYALLHDITHVPFGHSLEDELGLFDRHDINAKRIERKILDETTQIGSLLSHPEVSRVRDLFQRDMTVSRLSGIRDMVDSVVGADVLDYIDRDSYFAGIDQKIDSAIYRRFRLNNMNSEDSQSGRFYLNLFGNKGIRLDAELAAETIFLERYSLYLKIYTHPEKIAATAMLGKAIWVLYGEKGKLSDCEASLEVMGDFEFLHHLVGIAKKGSRIADLVTRLVRGQLFEPVYRCQLLNEDERNTDGYSSKQDLLAERKLLPPRGSLTPSSAFSEKAELEKEMAKNAGLHPEQVIIYCPRSAPGYNKVRLWVEKEEGQLQERTDSTKTHMEIKNRYLALWQGYVFVDPAASQEQKSKIAAHAMTTFAMDNQMNIGRRQLLFSM